MVDKYPNPFKKDRNHEPLVLLMRDWAERHEAETGHTVWVHDRGMFDLAVACITCSINARHPEWVG